MQAGVFAIGVGGLFLAAYFIYQRKIRMVFNLKEHHITPAVKNNDGFDYVPTKKPILFAQHVASIAAAGPIVGPIAACIAFGWAPTALWIIFGCILIGACHDVSSLIVSVRHDAKSIPEIARSYLGSLGYKLLLSFIWICLIYVIMAFTDVTAQQFLAKEQWGGVLHDIGGGVATSSILYLALSIIMGVAMTKWKTPLSLVTAIFFPALLVIILLGQRFPIVLPVSNPAVLWGVFILAYCAVASVLPMWLLLQPRGYLGGYFLYIIVVIGVLGLVFGDFTVKYPATLSFFSPRGDALFPFLFITVACGACSGFHGLVCSGTTSKQLSNECHAPAVGYGGMLFEGVIAILALTTVMIWPSGSPLLAKSPPEIYATGIAHFTNAILGIPIEWGITFGMLAFATFVYDTLDCATRLGRYLVEEFFGLKGTRGHWFAIVATLAIPLIYVISSPTLIVNHKVIPLWQAIWPLFGSSNQLLAALTLIIVIVWIKRTKPWPVWLVIPALFMLTTTTVALGLQALGAAKKLAIIFSVPAVIDLVITVSLLFLSITFVVASLSAMRVQRKKAAVL